ncbi:DUF72 domain-containing protein [Duganella callida]|uniref:DUF72 domain-containing protein n=1 Tax=Duganella callida TaxID=2561932 RepID=A0A4Y9S332_9BURK|nr:DUF72 domain-containing protein [Duganella callida]TFW15905.1 DUF72 domain-containing protein [Duganella callida]
MGKIHIGISGWRYRPWRGVFYPEGLAQARELAFASRQVSTIELNGSFYSLQRPSSYAAWYDATPPGFVFAHKGNRYLTHNLKLGEGTEQALANVMASGVLNLREKLGPFLWQLPPTFRFDADRLERFFRLLPRDLHEAQALARGHDARLDGRVALDVDANHKMRHALEVRHDSYNDPAFVALLRKHKVALVVADTAGKWPDYEDISAGFMYLRLHGAEQLYSSGYSDQALDHWAARIQSWGAGSQPRDARLISALAPPKRASRDVYCYFDNDVKVHAPFDAQNLARKLG